MKTEDVEKGLAIADKVADLGYKLLNFFNDNIPTFKANQIYIQEIEKNDKLSTSEKMALLYNAKAVKRNMENLYSVYELTNLMLKEKGSSLETADLDTDSEWFCMFSDIAKNVSNEGMQHIWAKILASKCEDKKSADKKLLSILQVMEYEDAEIFSYICANSVFAITNSRKIIPEFIYLSDLNVKAIFDESEESEISIADIYDQDLINHETLTQMQNLGLIKYHTVLSGYGLKISDDSSIVIDYYGKKIQICSQSEKFLKFGIVELTKCGQQLVKILHNGQNENKNLLLIDKLIEYYQKTGFEVHIL